MYKICRINFFSCPMGPSCPFISWSRILQTSNHNINNGKRKGERNCDLSWRYTCWTLPYDQSPNKIWKNLTGLTIKEVLQQWQNETCFQEVGLLFEKKKTKSLVKNSHSILSWHFFANVGRLHFILGLHKKFMKSQTEPKSLSWTVGSDLRVPVIFSPQIERNHFKKFGLDFDFWKPHKIKPNCF